MKMKMNRKNTDLSDNTVRNEDGSAMVIALLVMILLMGFVALAITRTNSETVASANDATESRTFDAANASLEIMTRNFDKIFDVKLNPDPADLTRINGQTPPGFPDYTFNQTVAPTGPAKTVIMKGGDFQGLNAIQDEWQLDTATTNTATGVQVALRRRFLNNRIPIFQFGIFYDDDMEFHPGPVFNFGGRVHSNGNIFLAAQSGLYFASKVTARYNVFTNVSKSGRPYSDWGDNVYIRNGAGVPKRLYYNMGSVLTSPINGAPVSNYSAPIPPAPTAYRNANWPTASANFDGNLLAEVRELRLPIKINAQNNGTQIDLIELVKRGKNVNTVAGTGDLWNDGTGTVAAPVTTPVLATTADDGITASERYYNKTGIRVSLADSKKKLPGCVTTGTNTAVGTPCGVRLDGDAAGLTEGAIAGTRGYNPRAMIGAPAYQATEVNGERLYMPGKEVWIKIETVAYNATTQAYDTVDITQDILSLGVTERAPVVGTSFRITQGGYNTGITDSRSVIKIQRFMMAGPWTSASNSSVLLNTSGDVAPNNFVTTLNPGAAGTTYNWVEPASFSGVFNCQTAPQTNITQVNQGIFPNGLTLNTMPAARITPDRAHWKVADAPSGGNTECVVAFPINMFDTREGLYNDTAAVFNPVSTTAPGYGTAAGVRVPWNGVMSMVDIDIANLRNFLNGNYDANMPNGTPFAVTAGRPLRSTDIPQANGWVFYISDRRGDRDFDGEYDMEDVFGNNDGILQLGEDINKNATLQNDYLNIGGAQEAVKYTAAGVYTPPTPAGAASAPAVPGSSVSPDIAAVFEHPFYRRGVRLINASDLPGIYDTATPGNTRGFTVASENGVYVSGNYNATGIASVGTPTPSTDYLPIGARDVPASIAADGVTILSNSWSDARSFKSPFTLDDRTVTETFTRFAMLSGDGITTLDATPNQGGGDTRMNGGVHNFLRFLEDWSTRLNYSGSLINLYNSHNNNGTFKCCNDVYSPPTRNWVFDSSFLDVNRIPPGTPFFQSIQITGFQRINN